MTKTVGRKKRLFAVYLNESFIKINKTLKLLKIIDAAKQRRYTSEMSPCIIRIITLQLISDTEMKLLPL